MTVTRWNQHNPTVAGSEWYPSKTILQTVTAGPGVGTQFLSAASESIDQIAPWVTAPTALHGSPQLQCDVYDLATVGAGWPEADLPVIRRYIKPTVNSGETVPPGFQKNSSGVLTSPDSNNFTLVDDASSDADATSTGSADGMQYNIPTSAVVGLSFGGGSTFLDAGTGGSVSNLSGLRIAYVEVVVTYRSFANQPGTMAGYLRLDGVNYARPAIAVPVSNAYVRTTYRFNEDPRTRLPWTNTAAQTLVATATNFFGFQVSGVPGSGNILITSISLRFATIPERRVATASAPLTTTDGWLPLICKNVGTGATSAWSKTIAHTYLLVFLDSLSVGVGAPKLSGVETALTAGHESDPAIFIGQGLNYDQIGGIVTIPGSYESPTTRNLAVLLGSTPSADSQPYASTRVDQVGGSLDQRLKQSMNAHGTLTYGTATVLVRTTSTAGNGVADQSAPMTITLKKTSDDSTLAGPFSLAVTEVPPDGKFHVVTVRFAAGAALTSGTGVYLELAATGSTVAWEASGLLTRIPPVPASDTLSAAGGAVGIFGSLSGAVAGTADATLDYPWNIGTVPTAPSGLAAAVASTANQPALTGPARVASISYAHLSWTATSLTSTFGYYEVQRLDGSDWNTISLITLEASNYFNDFEGPRNVTSPSYRLRVVRADGQPSSFATFPTVPIIPTASGCDLVLTSNFTPALTVAYQDQTPYEFELAETAAVVHQRILGRSRPVQFQPNGDGQGDIFTRVLTVALYDLAVRTGTIVGGRALFDPLIARVRDPIAPYVCVLDGVGRRWYCGLTFLRGSRVEPGGDYTATVQFNEVEGPSALTAATPPTVP